jgi:ABC-2 type transport system ATP-binding protein
MELGWAIVTEQLTKQYGRMPAVRTLNMKIARHRITGFLGRNGAGKTTTIKMLGMTRPTEGSGLVLGLPITNSGQNRKMRRQVAYAGEEKQLYDCMTVEQLIRFTASFYTDWRPDVAHRLRRSYELDLGQKIAHLSKGMRTKLALLLALARRPELLILDEPSDGLDPVAIEEFLQAVVAIANEGTTVFFSSHQIAEVERIADRVCVIDRGSLVADLALDEMRQDYRRITLGFAKEPPAGAFALDCVEHIETSGRQVTVWVNHNCGSRELDI